MEIPDKPIDREGFLALQGAFLSDCTHDKANHTYQHRCGGAIMMGFVRVTKEDGTPTQETISVPYCGRCDPPDGHESTYTVPVRLTN